MGHRMEGRIDRGEMPTWARARGIATFADLVAAAAHGLPVSIEQVDFRRIALKRLGLVGKSNQRARRPTDDELAKVISPITMHLRLTFPRCEVQFRQVYQ